MKSKEDSANDDNDIKYSKLIKIQQISANKTTIQTYEFKDNFEDDLIPSINSKKYAHITLPPFKSIDYSHNNHNLNHTHLSRINSGLKKPAAQTPKFNKFLNKINDQCNLFDILHYCIHCKRNIKHDDYLRYMNIYSNEKMQTLCDRCIYKKMRCIRCFKTYNQIICGYKIDSLELRCNDCYDYILRTKNKFVNAFENMNTYVAYDFIKIIGFKNSLNLCRYSSRFLLKFTNVLVNLDPRIIQLLNFIKRNYPYMRIDQIFDDVDVAYELNMNPIEFLNMYYVMYNFNFPKTLPDFVNFYQRVYSDYIFNLDLMINEKYKNRDKEFLKNYILKHKFKYLTPERNRIKLTSAFEFKFRIKHVYVKVLNMFIDNILTQPNYVMKLLISSDIPCKVISDYCYISYEDDDPDVHKKGPHVVRVNFCCDSIYAKVTEYREMNLVMLDFKYFNNDEYMLDCLESGKQLQSPREIKSKKYRMMLNYFGLKIYKDGKNAGREVKKNLNTNEQLKHLNMINTSNNNNVQNAFNTN